MKTKDRNKSGEIQMANLAGTIIYEWTMRRSGVGDKRFRISDVNGLPTLEERIGDMWVLVQVPKEGDALIAGIAQVLKRVHRAEKLLEMVARVDPSIFLKLDEKEKRWQ